MTGRIHAVLRVGLLIASIAASAGAAQATTLAARPEASAPALAAGEARPITGWFGFCERHPDECEVDTSEPAAITLTARRWQTIAAINRKVNATIEPLSDREHWDAVDRWDLPEDGLGDCEDFQLLKRKLLVDAGLPRRAMRMTVVVDDEGEGHALLMIRTDRGDLVLDNKTGAVLPWHQTGYVFIKREGQNGPGWVSLGGATSPVMTANP